MNYFIVNFDRQTTLSYRAFHDAFVAHPEIFRWCHYIKSSYVIGTSLTVNELSNHYADTAKQYGLRTTHLVLKVDLNERYGMLPKEAWEWFKKNAPNQ